MALTSGAALRLASQTLRKSLQTVPFGFVRAVSSDTLPIFLFHAVESSPKPYIKHLYDCHSPDSFERVLDEILAVFKPLEDLSPAGIANAGADRFLVTFDDGLRSSYEVATPILERKGIPAIHFLITDYLFGAAGTQVEEQFKASLLIEQLKGRSAADQEQVKVMLADAGYAGNLDQALMSIRLKDGALFDAVADRLDIDLAAFFEADRPYITQAEAADLVRRGFTLGAHSCSHPRYWELDLETQVDQTRRSMSTLTQAFGVSHRYFAFPYKNRGITSAFYERVREDVDVFFTTSGWGRRMNDQKVFHRVGMDHQRSAVEALKGGWRPYPLSLMQ